MKTVLTPTDMYTIDGPVGIRSWESKSTIKLIKEAQPDDVQTTLGNKYILVGASVPTTAWNLDIATTEIDWTAIQVGLAKDRNSNTYLALGFNGTFKYINLINGDIVNNMNLTCCNIYTHVINPSYWSDHSAAFVYIGKAKDNQFNYGSTVKQVLTGGSLLSVCWVVSVIKEDGVLKVRFGLILATSVTVYDIHMDEYFDSINQITDMITYNDELINSVSEKVDQLAGQTRSLYVSR